MKTNNISGYESGDGFIPSKVWNSCSDSNEDNGQRPARLWSLLEMLKFKGEIFHELASILGAIIGSLETGRSFAQQQKLSEDRLTYPDELHSNLIIQIPIFRKALELANLELSIDSVNRLETILAKRPVTMSTVSRQIGDLRDRIRDELSHQHLWLLTREDVRFLKTDPFGLEVPEKFPVTRDEIEEAGKCLAFGRGTASVFHLMRVTETGLRALGNSLNDPRIDAKRNPSWDAILKKCDEELIKPLKDRATEWRTDDQFFSDASARLHAVKDAWRNPTMHIERRYTPEEAEDVWNAVKAFMRHLAVKLSA